MQECIYRVAQKAPLSYLWYVLRSNVTDPTDTLLGQIYCSRCASNIIKGARFGAEGPVRVCNLCLDKLQTVDEDEDDSRSIFSSTTSPFAAHQLGSEARTFNLAHLPQSPFAASQLFGRNDSFSLFSIAETKRPYAGSDDSGMASRSITPDIGDQRPGHAPFRRAFTDEEKEILSMPEHFDPDHNTNAQGSKTPLDFPVTVPVQKIGRAHV